LPTGTYYYCIDKGNGDKLETGYLEIINWLLISYYFR
jgi:hypothetical protein